MSTLTLDRPAETPAAPERSLAQRMNALGKANDIRTRRAQFKRDLKAGRKQLGDQLQQPPDYLKTAKIYDLLVAVPKYGRVKANKILTSCRISPSKTLGGLSDRQRQELRDLLTGTATLQRQVRPRSNGDKVDDLLTDIAAGNASASEVLKDNPAWLAGTRAYDVLLAIPGYGGYKASRLMHACEIMTHKKIGDLTTNQRELIIRQLEIEMIR